MFQGHPQGPDEYSHQTWFDNQLKVDPNNMAYIARQSLATAYFARMHGNSPEILNKSSKLYSKALIQLRTAIEDPDTCYDHSNISATMAMTLYEQIIYTSDKRWVQHAGNTGRLIEMRGPHRHREWPAHGYYTLARSAIIHEAFMSRRRTFLENEEWHTIPLAKHPETKTPHQRLSDMLSCLPSLFEGYDAVSKVAVDSDEFFHLLKRFVPRIRDNLRWLIKWRWEWETAHKGPVIFERSVDPSTTWTLNADGRPIYPTVLYFSDMKYAQEFTLYNIGMTCLIHFGYSCHEPDVVKDALDSLPRDQEPRRVNPVDLPRAGLKQNDVANDSARTIDYYLEPIHAAQGSYSLMWPLRVCLVAFVVSREVEKIRFVTRVSKQLSQRHAFEINRKMMTMRIPGSSKYVESIDDQISQEAYQEMWEPFPTRPSLYLPVTINEVKGAHDPVSRGSSGGSSFYS